MSDEVLNFWIKRGLLVATEGGFGKGSHRRFHFAQLNIAALLGVFREHFGANIATLQSLAQLFQRAVKTFEKASLPVSSWSDAASIAQKLSDFRAGRPIFVNVHDYDDPDYKTLSSDEQMRKRPAKNEAEVLAESLDREVSPAALLKFAEAIGPGKYQDARVAKAILGSIVEPEHFGDLSWLMRQTDAGWDIREALDGLDFNEIQGQVFGPAVFVPVATVIRSVWDLPSWSQLRNLRIARECQSLLDELKIQALVTPANETDFYVHVDAPRAEWPVLLPLLKTHANYFELRDPAEIESDATEDLGK